MLLLLVHSLDSVDFSLLLLSYPSSFSLSLLSFPSIPSYQQDTNDDDERRRMHLNIPTTIKILRLLLLLCYPATARCSFMIPDNQIRSKLPSGRLLLHSSLRLLFLLSFIHSFFYSGATAALVVPPSFIRGEEENPLLLLFFVSLLLLFFSLALLSSSHDDTRTN